MKDKYNRKRKRKSISSMNDVKMNEKLNIQSSKEISKCLIMMHCSPKFEGISDEPVIFLF